MAPRSLFLLLAILAYGWLYPSASPAQLADYLHLPQIIPDRDIVVVAGGGAAWKKEWDQARRFWRSGDHAGAEESYRKLLAVKDSIAAARWELAQVLIRTEQWDQARRELELLVEAPPARIDYLNALGLVLRHLGQFGRALEVFDKAHVLAPDNFPALVGLTQGMIEVGRKKEAFPLLQLIVSQRPDDRELGLALASLAFELGRLETARKLLVPLTVGKNSELDTLLMVARVHEALGREPEAARYWERSLLLAPGNREAQGRLALYYENRGQFDKALAHLLALLEKNPQNTSLLSRISRIYVQTGRVAAARPYFERYVKLKPEAAPEALSAPGNLRTDQDDEQITFFRRLLAISPDDLGVLNNLAVELEAAGNPEGALFMWEHLARVAPERVEILRALAVMMDKMGRVEQLAVVLETLQRLVPDDLAVVSRLARLRAARGELDSSLALYHKLEQGGELGPDQLAGRAALYLELGQSAGALVDLQKLLEFSPGRHDIRRKSVTLAGALGEVDLLAGLGGDLAALAAPADRGPDLLLLAEAYGQAGDFSRASRYFQRVMANAGGREGSDAAGQRQLLRLARLGLAELYLRAELLDEAEQLLREGVLAGDARPLFFARLFDLALAAQPADLASAQFWLSQYQLEPGSSADDIALCQVRLLAAAGEYRQAEKTIRRFYEAVAGGVHSAANSDGILGRRAGLYLAQSLLAAGQLAEAEQQGLTLLGGNLDLEVMVLLQKIYQLSGSPAAAQVFHQLAPDETDGIKLLRLAELYEQYRLPASQATAAAMVLEKWPGSLRAGLQLAKGLLLQGNLSQALQQSVELATKFPECLAVNVLLAQMYYQGGNFPAAGRQCELVLEKEPGRLDVAYLKLRCELAQGHRAAAGRLMQEAFPEATELLFRKELLAAGLPVPEVPERQSLWQRLTSAEDAPDYLGELLAAERLLAEHGGAGQQLQLLAARFLSRYRWEKRFQAAILAE